MCLTVQAQVTIGDNKPPESFSVLELISNEKRGLRMAQMTTLQRNTMQATAEFQSEITGLARGLTIYNTDYDCMEYWNGAKWISTCQGETPPVIRDAKATIDGICVPYMFTYQTMPLEAIYTVSGATVKPTSYQWVVDGEDVPGATRSTYNFAPKDIVLTPDDLGNQKKLVNVTCKMGMSGVQVQPAMTYDILVVYGGTGQGELYPIYVYAYDENGKLEVSGVKNKLAFAHVNLGAENDTNPCDCKGYLFQWGREKDGNGTTTGHFRRNLTNTDIWPNGKNADGTYLTVAQDPADLDDNGQVKSTVADKYGRFLKNSSAPGVYGTAPWDWRNTRKDDLWGDDTQDYVNTKATADPCPSGWKVPSQKQWSAILNNTGTTDPTSAANASPWIWIGTGTFDDPLETSRYRPHNVRGYKIGESLYLQAAGYRSSNYGELEYTGRTGFYWSSTLDSSGYKFPYLLRIHDTYMHSGVSDGRAVGYGVRCILEL